MQESFQEFAKNYVLFCHVTTGIKTHPHEGLLQEKGGAGFPHIVFMDAAGKVLAEHEGPRTSEGFAKTGEQAKAVIDLKARAEKGDKGAKLNLVILQFETGQLTPDEARAQLKEAAEPSAEQKEKLDGLFNDAEILAVAASIKRGDQAGAIAAGKTFYERMKAGQPAPRGDQAVQTYWILMIEYAKSQKDAATFEQALGALKEKYANDQGAQEFFKKADADLEALKKAK